MARLVSTALLKGLVRSCRPSSTAAAPIPYRFSAVSQPVIQQFMNYSSGLGDAPDAYGDSTTSRVAADPDTHQVFQRTILEADDPDTHQDFQPTILEADDPNTHQDFQPTILEADDPYTHQDFQPSILEAADPDTHQNFQPAIYEPDDLVDMDQDIKPTIISPHISLHDIIVKDVMENPVVIYMKGHPDAPRCGFSALAVKVLQRYGVPITSRDIMADPVLKESVIASTDWPLFPQIFIKGEFIGGSDIILNMHQNDELEPLLADIAQKEEQK